jgi:hypothetical protein
LILKSYLLQTGRQLIEDFSTQYYFEKMSSAEVAKNNKVLPNVVAIMDSICNGAIDYIT